MNASTKSLTVAVTSVAAIAAASSAQAPGDVAYFNLHRTRVTAIDGTTRGYSGYLKHEQGFAPGNSISARRPNGQQTWDMSTPTQLMAFSGQSFMTKPQFDSWTEQNFKGTWQFGTNGALDRSYDTGASWDYYHQNLMNDYLTLTSASVALFESIRSQGLTGTFTFELTQPISTWNMGGWFQGGSALITNGPGPLSASPYQVPEINGSSFSITISSALVSDAQMHLSNATRFESPSLSQSRYVTFTNQSIYGFAVPAPSAIALLGLAGLAERRRRRA